MTIEEAQKELDVLKPQVETAWKTFQEQETIMKENRLQWHELQVRCEQLKIFIAMYKEVK